MFVKINKMSIGVLTLNGEEEPEINSLEDIKKYLEESNNDPGKLKKLKENLNSRLEPLNKYAGKFSKEVTNKEVIETLTNLGKDLELSKWSTLYKIHEVIEKAVGEKKLKAKNWIGAEQIKNFCRNADYYYRHSVKRVFNLVQPPKRKMEISEAEEIISTLLSKYVEEKVKIQGGIP